MRKYIAVIGAGFGDEGKGLVTSFLSGYKKDCLVVRYSGGHNAGHTVYQDGKIPHVFSNYGSGTFNRVPSYFSEHCTMEPVGLLNEYEKLKNVHHCEPIIYIDKNCKVTTPFDVHDNIKKEKVNRHGSVGVGLGSTHQREEDFYSLTFLDILYENVLKEKVKNIGHYYKGSRVTDKHLNVFYECCKDIREKMIQKNVYLSDGLPEFFDTYVFEGSQGLLLDQNYGFFPNVTRSNTGTKNILSMIPKEAILEIYLVTRAYQTRHGNGFMTNEDLPHNIKVNPDETNVTHKHQGNFRRSLLDVSLLQYAIEKDSYINSYGLKRLVITCLDHVVNEWRFTYKDKIITCNNEIGFVEGIAKLLDIQRVCISKSPNSALESLSIDPPKIRVLLG